MNDSGRGPAIDPDTMQGEATSEGVARPAPDEPLKWYLLTDHGDFLGVRDTLPEAMRLWASVIEIDPGESTEYGLGIAAFQGGKSKHWLTLRNTGEWSA